jgi:hypothetical protein
MACGGSKETEKRTPPTSDNSNKYEDEFRPSDFDIDAKIFFSELRKENEKKAVSTEQVVTESPTVVAGFRVQLFATEEIDVANAKKAAAEAEFPEELFYIAYDPPTYKLRAGNFLNRADADAYAKILSERGYPDAWVVPERVFKNPPTRPTSQPQEQ